MSALRPGMGDADGDNLLPPIIPVLLPIIPVLLDMPPLLLLPDVPPVLPLVVPPTAEHPVLELEEETEVPPGLEVTSGFVAVILS